MGLEFKKVKKSYESGFVLKDISFKIKNGKIFALIGGNGAGKTTIIRLILKIIKIDSGNIELNNKRSYSLKDIGFVLEDEKLFENLTPIKYLHFFIENYKINFKNSKKIINRYLTEFNLYEKKDVLIKNLSKGMKRKLSLIKSIIHNPRLLILDEPFNGIEPKSRKEIKNKLIRYVSKGNIVFITSHILDEIEKLADEFGIIYNGQIKGLYSMNEIKNSLEEFYYQKVQ
ncbi:MAG: ABC transporter ATP-binding protein [Candidatus Mcinerneyibacterium aminivorans]|jgi:ABC-type multidrug transport system ATPase subunit|uniref:ABC transporter ATP-binding protein n=1 Tax=Candidatus Mcinerneyibacterium aminivorans TaxID=2703815 RepID=A0A5D0MJN2_9BACT|nr:MAG: ABC transporter ATP-binding protein [Candidatus Mcinerneyibacterium aminivorans]